VPGLSDVGKIQKADKKARWSKQGLSLTRIRCRSLGSRVHNNLEENGVPCRKIFGGQRVAGPCSEVILSMVGPNNTGGGSVSEGLTFVENELG